MASPIKPLKGHGNGGVIGVVGNVEERVGPGRITGRPLSSVTGRPLSSVTGRVQTGLDPEFGRHALSTGQPIVEFLILVVNFSQSELQF